MLFNSLSFLYGFLPITYLVFWRLRTKNQRYAWLALTGYIFYGFWNWKFCFLMAFSTLVSYSAGLGFLQWDEARRRRVCLVLPIVVDLSLLGFFKYANFALETAGAVLTTFHAPVQFSVLDVQLPVGISFYTFHTISYIIDSYRRTIVPTKNFFEFCCYVSLFSQLVAGPIVRFREIEADLEHIDQDERRRALPLGWSFFCIGLAQKVLLADSIARTIDPALLQYASLSSVGAWLAMLGYAYQLYFDFAGYSNMAVGLGLMFGIRIPQNFNSPYKALNPADFWRRWHMSLSSWLRDYLYIPLGGNRGPRWFVIRNLLITMLLGGLWHGAHWTFVVWGAYHGVLLVLYRYAGASWDRLPRVAQRAGMFLLVVIGWVFFRSTDFTMARTLLGKMFAPAGAAPFPAITGLSAFVLIAAAIAHCAPNTFEMRHDWRPLAVAGWAWVFAAAVLVIYGGEPTPFLYFQF
jgi:alginate O-acetyltransferase complex protein AlgI